MPPTPDAPEPPKGSDVFHASLFLPPEKRRAIFALEAFHRELRDLAARPPDGRAAPETLDAWRREIDALFADGPPPGNPAVARLAPHVTRFAIPRDALLEQVDGVRMDLERRRYATWEDLRPYCARTASSAGRAWLAVLGHRNPASSDYVAELGLALGLIRILGRVGEDGRNGRVYLPEEELVRFDSSAEDVLAGRSTRAFRAAMAFQCARARRVFFRAESMLPAEDRMALFALEILARIHYRILERIEASGFDVLGEPVQVPSYRKGLTALGTWFKYRILR